MIPIRDVNGTVIGFGGRDMKAIVNSTVDALFDGTQKRKVAKYINSPNSES
jgi:DNA primase